MDLWRDGRPLSQASADGFALAGLAERAMSDAAVGPLLAQVAWTLGRRVISRLRPRPDRRLRNVLQMILIFNQPCAVDGDR